MGLCESDRNATYICLLVKLLKRNIQESINFIALDKEFEFSVQIDKDRMYQICLPTKDTLRKELWVKHGQWAVQSADDVEKIYKCCLLGWKAEPRDYSIASFNVFVVEEQLISRSNDEISTT